MDASFINDRLHVLYGNHQYILKNTYIFDWECDFFSVTKNGTIYETEIKISRADFKKDFEKPKHQFFVNHKTGFYQYRWPEYSENLEIDVIGWENRIHYGEHKWKAYPHCRQKWYNSEDFFIPHRFSFACPQELIHANEVPAYAGLIWVWEDGSMEIVKAAPFMHKRPIMASHKMHTILMDKFYYLSLNQRREIRRLS